MKIVLSCCFQESLRRMWNVNLLVYSFVLLSASESMAFCVF